jgi:hypothetical protein
VNLGGTIYVVPPLALGALKTLLPKIKALTIGADGMPDLARSRTSSRSASPRSVATTRRSR